MNQQLLDLIGVGHQSLTQVCSICRSHDLSCKLTGSGGGGCAFAIIRPGEVYCTFYYGLFSIYHPACWQPSYTFQLAEIAFV